MICANCGSQNPDGSAKCAVCGASLAQEEKETSPGKTGFSGLNRNKLTGYAIIAAVLLVVIILLIVIFSGRSDKSTLKQYVNAVFDLNAKKIVALYPKATIENYAETEEISKSEAKEEIIDSLQDRLDRLEDYYDEVDVEEIRGLSVEIRHEDNYTSKEIRKYNENLEEQDINMKIKDAKVVEIKVSGKQDGDKFKFRVDGILMVKVGSSWYLIDPNPSMLFDALEYELSD